MKLRNDAGKNEFKLSKTAGDMLPLHAEASGRPDLALKSYAEFSTLTPEDVLLDEQRYARFVTPATMVDGHFAALEQTMQERLEQRKKEMIEQLENRRKEMRQEKKIRKAKEEAEAARNRQVSGFNFDGIDSTAKKAFRAGLKAPLEEYLDALALVTDLADNESGGRLPEAEHEQLLATLKRLYKDENVKGKKNWRKPEEKNFHFNEVAKWVGSQKTRTWWPLITE
jgi:hypothetical protein